ncbi:MAG: PhnB protein [Myxococcaceae bacterium]|nr:PhnB protein [Myxococcaceae bacterium]
MSTQKYLFIYHMPKGAPAGPRSPEEIQAMLGRWHAWKEKFQQEVVDFGDGLKPGGKQLIDGVVTDGPYPESKDVVGGYSIVAAGSYEQALVVARGCPFAAVSGGRIELRELAGH